MSGPRTVPASARFAQPGTAGRAVRVIGEDTFRRGGITARSYPAPNHGATARVAAEVVTI